ncbi:MAG: hypothetical protein WKF34_07315 [Pyrinomonadaceae bacterium]
MPDTRSLPFRERLALDLSDLAVAGDIAPGDATARPVDVIIRTHFVAMDSLPPPPDDPLRRRDDPMARLYGEFLAHQSDYAKAEPELLKWLRASPENAEQFAENPFAALAGVPHVEPEVKARLGPLFGRHSGAVMPRLAGARVTEMSFDALDALPPADPPPGKAGEDIDSDALFEVGLSQLARILGEKLLPPIREAASEIAFLVPPVNPLPALPGTVRLLAGRPGDPLLVREATDTLKLTMGFNSGQLEIGPVSPSLTDLGPVTLDARLKLSITPATGGALLNLELVPGGLTISQPPGLGGSVLTNWNAAAPRIVQALSPLFAYPVRLTFPTGLCDLGPRAVAAALLPPADGTMQDSLALAIALFEGTVPGFAANARSRVAASQDGALFLSNRLMVEVACCLLSQSAELATLPPPVVEASDAEAKCRWENIGNFRLGQEVYDELVFLEVKAVDGGFETSMELKKSGFGWRMTVHGGAEIKLNLFEGKITVSAIPTLIIHTDVACWVHILGILAIIAGAIVLYFSGGTGAAFAVGLFTLGAGLLVLTLGHLVADLLDALIPGNLVDPSQLLGLLPGGLGHGFGQLSFLTSLEWDDLELGGYMTTPGSPLLVAGGDFVLAPGWGIDLDIGEMVPPVDLTSRMDADLRLREPPGLAMARMVADSGSFGARTSTGSVPVAVFVSHASGVGPFDNVGPIHGRSLEAIGASRLVPFGTRPYASIGFSDLAGLGFPQSATSLSVPSAPSTGSNALTRTFAVRTSAGRLASCAVWTDQQHRTMLRFRTFDTPIWLSLSAETSVEAFGKPEFGQSFVFHGIYTALPGSPWPPLPATSYRWYWSGVELVGTGLLDQVGNRFTIIGNRCEIHTVQGADLEGWLCGAASKPSGLEAVACRNIRHMGKLPGTPNPGGGFPGSGGPGGGFGGGLPGGGGPDL